MDSITKTLSHRIQLFHWWNYGLDEVHAAQSTDWADALAQELIDALVEQGRILPPAGTHWIQWAVRSDVFDDGWFIDPSEERVRAQADLVAGGPVLCRDVIDWPPIDDAHPRTWPRYVGPWREAPEKATDDD